jgi:hypothetical protein
VGSLPHWFFNLLCNPSQCNEATQKSDSARAVENIAGGAGVGFWGFVCCPETVIYWCVAINTSSGNICDVAVSVPIC